jgi:uncharacterized protein (DUF433 family)
MSMAMTETCYAHIVLDASGIPLIAGTTMKVGELVLDQQAYGWSPEELHFQHPYLSLGQIHSALAYYWDHKEEIDRDLDRRYELAEQLRQATPQSPLVARLKAEGLA